MRPKSEIYTPKRDVPPPPPTWALGLSSLQFQGMKPASLAPRETENNDYAKFWGDKQRALWYVMVFSGVVNC